MTTTRRTAKWALAALATLAIQACAAESTGPSAAARGALASGEVREGGEGGDWSVAAEELRASRERWEAAGVEDYRYTIRTLCSCDPETFLVEVREGKAVSVTRREASVDSLDNFRKESVDSLDNFRTAGVDSLDNFRKLFDRVQAAIESRPDGLKVAYDREWRYPLYLWVDPTLDRADEDYGWLVEKFEPLR
jgi:hypothetical protein